MPFGTTLRAAGLLVASPVLAALLGKIITHFMNFIPSDSMLGRAFTATGEYFLLVVILSLIILVAAAAIAQGGRFA